MGRPTAGIAMRRIVLGLIGATSMLAVPPRAAQAADVMQPTPLALVVSGIVESWTGYTFIADPRHVHPDEDSFGSAGSTGRLSLPLGTNLSIQGDVDLEYNSTLLTDDDDDGSRDIFQLSISQQPLERGIFALELFEPFGVLGLQAAELVTPPVIRRFADTQLAAHRRGVLALGQQPIGRHQLAHNLFGAVPLPRCHDLVEPSCPRRGPQDSHKPGPTDRGQAIRKTASATAPSASPVSKITHPHPVI